MTRFIAVVTVCLILASSLRAPGQQRCPGGVCPVPYGSGMTILPGRRGSATIVQPGATSIRVQGGPGLLRDPPSYLTPGATRIRVQGGGLFRRPSVEIQTPAAAPQPFVCQVWLSPNQTPASGVLVAVTAEYALVATCRHVADQGIYAVRFSGRGDYPAREGFHDKLGYDLAILRIDAAPVSPVEFGSRPQLGQIVTIAGYGNGRYGEHSGLVLGFTVPNAGQSYGELRVATRSPSGDSGGAMLDSHGRLVGILWGTDSRGAADSIGVPVEAVREFVGRVHVKIAGQQQIAVDESPIIVPAPDVSPNEPDRPSEYYGKLVPIVRRNTEQIDELAEVSQKNTMTIAALTDKVMMIEKTEGPPGEPGPAGPAGAQGLVGEPGPAYQLTPEDTAAIAVEAAGMIDLTFDPSSLTEDQLAGLAARLPPIYIRQIDMESGEEKIEEVFLGEGLLIRLFKPE